MAEELGLKGDDKADYLRRHAKAKGYREIPTFVREGSEEEQGFFGKAEGDKGSGGRRESGDSGGWFK
jgi:hypothetical protein